MNHSPLISPVGAPQPALEARLEHLHKAVERIQHVQRRLEDLADGLSTNRVNHQTAADSPPCQDLSGRFGDAIGYIHATRKVVFSGGTHTAGRRQAKIQAWNHKQAVKARHRAVKRARMGT